MEKVGIVIVDDQNIFRQILGLAIANVDGLDVVNSYADGQIFLNDLATWTTRPDIVIFRCYSMRSRTTLLTCDGSSMMR